VHEVVALIHTPQVKWLPRNPTRAMDVRMGNVIKAATLERIGHVDVIFHLAAVASIAKCERRPEVARLTNFQGTVNILNWALMLRPMPRIVFTSTAALYGEPEYLPIDENHPVEPYNHYTYSKLSAEIAVNGFHVDHGLPSVIVRPFNIYGPRQDPYFLIPTIITQCLQGVEVRLGDGRPVRNFTYVTDAVDLLLRASVHPAVIGRVVNLGSRQTYRVSEIAEKLVDVTGCGLDPVYDPMKFRETEPTSLEMDPALAERLLGWVPRVWLDDGLKMTIDHYRAGVDADKRRVAEELYGEYYHEKRQGG
jgi:nucleoside-diphosphate-sugar epimerase